VPTYQYACKDCGHSFEQFQSFTDDALTICPVCEGRLRKVFNAVGVVFKGSGFYRTDSRSAEKSGTSSGSSGSSETGSDGSKKSEPAANGTSSDKGASTGSAATTTSSDSTSAA
jgi:putative FmdB family regulatory protein